MMWKIGAYCFMALSATSACSATPVHADALASMRARYAVLANRLQSSPFKQPVVLDSVLAGDHFMGDVYAVVAYPFGTVLQELNSANHWCDVLSLHANTKYCHAVVDATGVVLRVYIGKKTPQPLEAASEITLNYSVANEDPDFLHVVLQANDGPMGTSDYKIQLQAIALSAKTTFLQLTYSYTSGVLGRMAMQTYLATLGAGKVGFTVAQHSAQGRPVYVKGVLGLVERNTMRFYFAIDSFLSASTQPSAQQLENRLQGWFSSVEKYPLQLHEMQRSEYLEMKRAEYARQRVPL